MRYATVVIALGVAGHAICSETPSPEPLVPEGLAVTHIFVSEDATARRWFGSEDDEAGSAGHRRPQVQMATLNGVDEADVVALHIVVTGEKPAVAAKLLTIFMDGHHGALERVPQSMVTAIAAAIVSPVLLSKVDDMSANLRGKRKPPEYMQLSIEDLQNLVGTCRKAGKGHVFLNLSE